jgi:hypothetical protein
VVRARDPCADLSGWRVGPTRGVWSVAIGTRGPGRKRLAVSPISRTRLENVGPDGLPFRDVWHTSRMFGANNPIGVR